MHRILAEKRQETNDGEWGSVIFNGNAFFSEQSKLRIGTDYQNSVNGFKNRLDRFLR